MGKVRRESLMSEKGSPEMAGHGSSGTLQHRPGVGLVLTEETFLWQGIHSVRHCPSPPALGGWQDPHTGLPWTFPKLSQADSGYVQISQLV